MVEKITYSIYCIYTSNSDIYIGMSKHPYQRFEEHKKRTCNYRLKALFDRVDIKIYFKILYENLAQKEASDLEKHLIKYYRNKPNYNVLNIQSGGIRGNAKTLPKPRISTATKHLSDDQIIQMRYKYSTFKGKFNKITESKLYNIHPNYFMKILRGKARSKLPGPILGKEYNRNG